MSRTLVRFALLIGLVMLVMLAAPRTAQAQAKQGGSVAGVLAQESARPAAEPGTKPAQRHHATAKANGKAKPSPTKSAKGAKTAPSKSHVKPTSAHPHVPKNVTPKAAPAKSPMKKTAGARV